MAPIPLCPKALNPPQRGADICLAGQVFAAGYFDAETTAMPTVMRIFEECMKINAFDRAQPLKQPDAPKSPAH